MHPRDHIHWLEAGLAAARRLGDRGAEGVHLGNLGPAYYSLGDYPRAIEHHEQRIEIARQIGDRRGEALASWNLGLTYEKLGDLESAITAMQICVDFERQIGHPDAEKDAAEIEQLRARLESETEGD